MVSSPLSPYLTMKSSTALALSSNPACPALQHISMYFVEIVVVFLSSEKGSLRNMGWRLVWYQGTLWEGVWPMFLAS